MAQKEARRDVIDKVLAVLREKLETGLPDEDATLEEIEDAIGRLEADFGHELKQRCVAKGGIRLPDWMATMDAQLDALRALPERWDSYSARRVDPEVTHATDALLRAIVQPDTPCPSIVPTARGGIQVEWHSAGIDLEIEIPSPGCYQILYENALEATGEEVELGVTDLPRLQELVGKLSSTASRPSPLLGAP